MTTGKKSLRAGSAVMLVSAALIWGVAFVAQTTGMDHVGPWTLSAVRMLLAGLALIPAFLLFDRLGLSPKGVSRKETWRAGLILGCVLFVAANLQQVGLMTTSVAKSGFITSLYIVLVPLFGVLVQRRSVRPVIWLSVALAVGGLYLLATGTDGFSVTPGDLLTLACAGGFAAHILTAGYFANRADVLRMSCIQFFTASALSAVVMLFTEEPKLTDIAAAWLPITYAGVLSGGAAYTLQMLGQRNIEPAAASLLLSPEAVFAALAGWLLLGQTLTGRELIGCALVFAAVLLSQLPEKTNLPGEAPKTERSTES